MTLDLATVTHETFEPLIGDAFEVIGMNAALVLEGVEEGIARAGARTPFSLEFTGPAEPALAQQTVRLEHEVLGELAIFVVPLERDLQATRYEAVFS